MPRIPKWSFPFRSFPLKRFKAYAFSISSICSIRTAHLILLDLVTLIIFGGEHNSLRHFLHSHFNELVTTLFFQI
jgi:hypothetical protein